MNFGQALEAIKSGGKVRRDAWDDGVYVFLVPGSTFNVSRAPLLGIYQEGTEIEYYQHIDVVYSEGRVAVWWVNQVDILEDDWVVCG